MWRFTITYIPSFKGQTDAHFVLSYDYYESGVKHMGRSAKVRPENVNEAANAILDMLRKRLPEQRIYEYLMELNHAEKEST